MFVCLFVSTYKPSDEQCMDRRLWPTQKSIDERAKHLYYCQQHQHPVSHQRLLTSLVSYRHHDLLETFSAGFCFTVFTKMPQLFRFL